MTQTGIMSHITIFSGLNCIAIYTFVIIILGLSFTKKETKTKKLRVNKQLQRSETKKTQSIFSFLKQNNRYVRRSKIIR
jgi:hypothetical protein